MIKFLLTGVIIYFLVRSIANKPWLSNEVHIHQSKTPDVSAMKRPKAHQEDDFTEYEEVD